MNRPASIDSSSRRSRRGVNIPALLAFEVTRGQTTAPLRPLNRERFLLGSGEKCDMRLGGRNMPTVHSVVVVEGQNAIIELLADEPSLRVNGRAVQSSPIEPGDRIQIGGIELILRPLNSSLERSTEESGSELELAQTEFEDEAAAEESLEDMSAAELCELIEREEEMIADFEARRQLGAAALLQQARQRRQPAQDEQTTESPQELVRELRLAIQELNRLASDLDHRIRQMTAGELRTEPSLLSFQQNMISRLDGVLVRVAGLSQREETVRPNRDAA